MRRGEIWVANFSPWRGQEVGKARPSLILQADWLTNLNSETILVLPLTTQLWQGSEQLRIPLAARGRIKQRCYIMIDKMRAIDRRQFGQGPLTELTGDEMFTVERRLKVVLDLF